MEPHFREQLIDLWDGKLFQQREVVNYALDGTKLHLLLQFSVLPGHERDWSLVQVALTDITARKKAEAYLEYLGNHDVLTKLCNRSFFVDELNRLERKGPLPVTIIMADLNGLKTANDELGHAVGDALLRRAGEVFGSLVEKPASVARIGGDEFAVILPSIERAEGEAMMKVILDLVAINNEFYTDLPLSQPVDGHSDQRAGRAAGSRGQARRPRHAGGQARALFQIQWTSGGRSRRRRNFEAVVTVWLRAPSFHASFTFTAAISAELGVCKARGGRVTRLAHGDRSQDAGGHRPHRFGFAPAFSGGLAAFSKDLRAALIGELDRPNAAQIINDDLPSVGEAARATYDPAGERSSQRRLARRAGDEADKAALQRRGSRQPEVPNDCAART